MIRSPAVAGAFYPGNAAQLGARLDQLVRPSVSARPALAVVVPHAGWMYSGATAGRLYSQVRVPDRVILIGPNHHGLGSDYAVFDVGSWRTPIGDVPIAEPLAAKLLDHSEWLAADAPAHAREHSLEVQVPMLLRCNPGLHLVPILIGGLWPESGGRDRLREIGAAIAVTVKESGRPVLLVASSDLNHFEDESTSRAKDRSVLEAIVGLDEEGLMDRVIGKNVSMCGVAPAYVVLVAAKQLGARRAEVIDYRTSGEVNGDFGRVVGYGAVVIE